MTAMGDNLPANSSTEFVRLFTRVNLQVMKKCIPDCECLCVCVFMSVHVRLSPAGRRSFTEPGLLFKTPGGMSERQLGQ